jgi:hypothetical protein
LLDRPLFFWTLNMSQGASTTYVVFKFTCAVCGVDFDQDGTGYRVCKACRVICQACGAITTEKSHRYFLDGIPGYVCFHCVHESYNGLKALVRMAERCDDAKSVKE